MVILIYTHDTHDTHDTRDTRDTHDTLASSLLEWLMMLCSRNTAQKNFIDTLYSSLVHVACLGKTLCPPDCLMKSDIRAASCAAIFRLGIVVLQCVLAGQGFFVVYMSHMFV